MDHPSTRLLIPFMMHLSTILLSVLFLPLSIHAVITSPPPAPRGIHIDCGSQKEQNVGGIQWIRDDGFTNVGNATELGIPGIMPILSSLRYFPDKSSRKYCYTIHVARGAKYLIRTTYYYGGFDGGKEPPVFDQIIGGTIWSTVNTSENYAKGHTSYYEIILASLTKTLSVCLARNDHSASNPFISAIELENLEDSMYNSTDFTKYALGSIARHRFGHNSQLVSYPDDPFNRYWGAFKDGNPVVESRSNISASDFWNLPPQAAFQTALTTSRGKKLIVQWPPMELPSTSYYLALYFQDNRTPSPFSWRVFDVFVNGKDFYKGLNVSTSGVMVYGTHWPLSGHTQITLNPAADSPVGPVINAGEILQIITLGGRTSTKDVIVMEELARRLDNIPVDWSGDPCLPRKYSWTGVICSQGKLARVVALNLTNYGLSGSLPASIANLTAISSIWLGGNKLSGSIPDMGSLKELVSLHLENNQLNGTIPSSLGNLELLQELFLQNNNLKGHVPDNLNKRTGINIKIFPGNKIS